MDNSDLSFCKVFTTDSDRIVLITAHKATLAIDHIITLRVSDEQSTNAPITDVFRDKVQDPSEHTWVKCGTVTLTKQDTDHLMEGREVSDKHINFAQLLLKLEFPDVDGFRNTLEQNKLFKSYQNAQKYVYHKMSLGMHSMS